MLGAGAGVAEIILRVAAGAKIICLIVESDWRLPEAQNEKKTNCNHHCDIRYLPISYVT